MDDTRNFTVHTANDIATHRVEETSFEAAALAFADIWHPGADNDGDITVFVTEEITGLRQCFRVDVADGEATPCD